MCEFGEVHQSILKVKTITVENKIFDVRKELKEDGYINVEVKDDEEIVKNKVVGINWTKIEVDLKTVGPKEKKPRKYWHAIVEVIAKRNEVYHLMKDDIDSNDGEKFTEEQEKEICCHEIGHKDLFDRIIPWVLDFKEKIPSYIKTENELNLWGEKVKTNWKDRFLEICKKAENLYHREYGNNGSPWTFDRRGKKNYEQSWEWRDIILKRLKISYPEELKHL